MSAPNWGLFASGALLATTAVLVLSWLSGRAFASEASPGRQPGPLQDGPDPVVPTGVAFLANLLLTHALLGAVLAALVLYAAVPLHLLGIAPVTAEQVAIGLGLGVGLYLASETATAVARLAGVEYDERLRSWMAPERPLEWVVLTVLVLPVIAGAEELLFRGILIGAFGAAFELPVAALVVGSSLLFGLGHTAQGSVGVAVTAALGLVLAAAFVVTGNLLGVVIAHYVVDVLEFVVREGLLDRTDPAGG